VLVVAAVATHGASRRVVVVVPVAMPWREYITEFKRITRLPTPHACAQPQACFIYCTADCAAFDQKREKTEGSATATTKGTKRKGTGGKKKVVDGSGAGMM
jgi:hypothetical protein